MLTQEQLKQFAKELQIDEFTAQREYLQLLFLKYFYRQKQSARTFFKGGTALRLIFNSFRFSEDLDFSSLENRAVLQKMIGAAVKGMSKETPELSFKEEKTIASAFSGRIFQKVKNYRMPLTIRLDFSLREKPIFTETSLIETIFPIGPYPQVNHLKAEEILAEKIRAILSRERGRDLFDLWFLLSKKIVIDWPLVNQKMSLYNKKANLKDLIVKAQKMSLAEIKNDLTKFLPLSHRNLVSKIQRLVIEKLQERKA